MPGGKAGGARRRQEPSRAESSPWLLVGAGLVGEDAAARLAWRGFNGGRAAVRSGSIQVAWAEVRVQSRGIAPRADLSALGAAGAPADAGLAQSLAGWEGGGQRGFAPLCRLLGKGCPEAGPFPIAASPAATSCACGATPRWFSCLTSQANRGAMHVWSVGSRARSPGALAFVPCPRAPPPLRNTAEGKSRACCFLLPPRPWRPRSPVKRLGRAPERGCGGSGEEAA